MADLSLGKKPSSIFWTSKSCASTIGYLGQTVYIFALGFDASTGLEAAGDHVDAVRIAYTGRCWCRTDGLELGAFDVGCLVILCEGCFAIGFSECLTVFLDDKFEADFSRLFCDDFVVVFSSGLLLNGLIGETGVIGDFAEWTEGDFVDDLESLMAALMDLNSPPTFLLSIGLAGGVGCCHGLNSTCSGESFELVDNTFVVDFASGSLGSCFSSRSLFVDIFRFIVPKTPKDFFTSLAFPSGFPTCAGCCSTFGSLASLT
jgi:hypothetical protein